MATSDNYAERFKALRRREWLVFGLFLGYMPVVGALAWLVSRVTPSESPVMILALAWMLAFALAGLRVSLFRCPRCAKLFHMNKYLVTTLGRKCPLCGLRRYAKAYPPGGADRPAAGLLATLVASLLGGRSPGLLEGIPRCREHS